MTVTRIIFAALISTLYAVFMFKAVQYQLENSSRKVVYDRIRASKYLTSLEEKYRKRVMTREEYEWKKSEMHRLPVQ